MFCCKCDLNVGRKGQPYIGLPRTHACMLEVGGDGSRQGVREEAREGEEAAREVDMPFVC